VTFLNNGTQIPFLNVPYEAVAFCQYTWLGFMSFASTSAGSSYYIDNLKFYPTQNSSAIGHTSVILSADQQSIFVNDPIHLSVDASAIPNGICSVTLKHVDSVVQAVEPQSLLPAGHFAFPLSGAVREGIYQFTAVVTSTFGTFPSNTLSLTVSARPLTTGVPQTNVGVSSTATISSTGQTTQSATNATTGSTSEDMVSASSPLSLQSLLFLLCTAASVFLATQ